MSSSLTFEDVNSKNTLRNSSNSNYFQMNRTQKAIIGLLNQEDYSKSSDFKKRYSSYGILDIERENERIELLQNALDIAKSQYKKLNNKKVVLDKYILRNISFIVFYPIDKFQISISSVKQIRISFFSRSCEFIFKVYPYSLMRKHTLTVIRNNEIQYLEESFKKLKRFIVNELS